MSLQTWIALLRGVNVGGHGKLPMKQWAAELEALGCTHVKTYIQSGNAVFRGPKVKAMTLAGRIASGIQQNHGIQPQVILLRPEQLERAIGANPFPEAEPHGNRLALFFLAESLPRADKPRLDAVKAESERWMLKDGVFYLHAPDGFGRSKLAANAEKLLGVPATARNWNTVLKLLQMAKDLT